MALRRLWLRGERQLGTQASVCPRPPVSKGRMGHKQPVSPVSRLKKIESARKGPGGGGRAERGEVSGTALSKSTPGSVRGWKYSELGRAPSQPANPLVSQGENQSPERGANPRELHSSVETGKAWDLQSLYSSKRAGTCYLGLWDHGLQPLKCPHSTINGNAAFPRALQKLEPSWS